MKQKERQESHVFLQKSKSLFSRKAKPESARKLNEKEQKDLNDMLFAVISKHKKFTEDATSYEPAQIHIVSYPISIIRIKRLLKAGANLEARDNEGRTPLMYAIFTEHMDISKILVENGAEIEAKNNDDMTALMFAAASGNHKIANYLISRGADVNAKDRNGHTPLVLAVHNDFVRSGSGHNILKTAKILIKNGAIIGQNALMCAGRDKTIEFLKKAMLAQLEKQMGKQNFSLFMQSFKECTA
jgi:ankyrin repeat protein